MRLAAQQRAWLDAADLVDDKWERAFAQADLVRAGFAHLLGDAPERIALGANTHELVVRFLSALPLRTRPRLVTTDGEFHSLRRQLDRLAEEGVEVVRVAARPVETLVERMAKEATDRTAAVLVSAVLFETAEIVPRLGDLLTACGRAGAELLVDAYHAVNVVPFTLAQERLTGAYVVGGGYKYCQLGEGNCFLRFPEGSVQRPVITGWYSEFELLEDAPRDGRVPYGAGPARFAGSTYDPASNYRGAEVFAFFREMKLTPERLRALSQHQVARLAATFDALDEDPHLITRDPVPLEQIAGFLALKSARAGELSRRLRAFGVFTDYRGSTLRLGPAPYVTDDQLDHAIAALGEAARAL